MDKVIIEKSRASSLLNIICRQIWYQRKSDYMDRALGWIWADLQYWKKWSGWIVSSFWGVVFHIFRGKRNVNFLKKNIVASALKSFMIFHRLRNVFIVSCSNRDTSPRDLSIMTLVMDTGSSKFWEVMAPLPPRFRHLLDPLRHLGSR